MAEIINLNKARKARNRADAKAQAEQNRAAFGRSKLETELAEAEKIHRDQLLDGAKRDRPDTDDESAQEPGAD